MPTEFDEAEADAWREDLLTFAPSLRDVPAAGHPDIAGVALRADGAGVLYRLRARDGREFTFRMNAVAARILAVATIGEAQAQGWMDGNGQIATSDGR